MASHSETESKATLRPGTAPGVVAPLEAESSLSFAELGLEPRLLTTLSALGYEAPTAIQREAIPFLLSGNDLLGQAATGTGKTAAFALPMLQHIAPEAGAGKVLAIVLVPTRELAIQVAQAVHRYGRELSVTVLPIYGGQSMGMQLRALRRGIDVVVGTPGRVLDHLRRGTLTLSAVRVLVLDEADEMLDMGFAEDLDAILETLPEQRQTALFSATIPPRIAQIAKRHQHDPVRISISREPSSVGELPLIRQVAYVAHRGYKGATLGRVLDMENPSAALVFCRTRTQVDELVEALNSHGYSAEALHGGLSQDQRDRVMNRFRTGTAELLVATDVAARGLDIEHISHVVNYDVPDSPESYIHRIGRTGRAGRPGVAITLMEPREHRLLRNIEYYTRHRIEVAMVPTLADLRARRLELLRTTLQETLLEGELERYRGVVEALGAEFDIMDVAAAAVKLVHQASGEHEEEEDIPIYRPLPDRGRGDRRDFRAPASRDEGRWRRQESSRHEDGRQAPNSDRPASFQRSDSPGSRGRPRGDGGRRNDSFEQAVPRSETHPQLEADRSAESSVQEKGARQRSEYPDGERKGESARRSPLRPGRSRREKEAAGSLEGQAEGAPGGKAGRAEESLARLTGRSRSGTPAYPKGGPGGMRPLRRQRKEPETGGGGAVKLFVNAGRMAKVRPADIVGVLANEAGIDPHVIGLIEIFERHSLLELPDELADAVIRTLKGVTIRGKPVVVRRFREP